ncbi:EamA family transporter [Phenylobacterium sp.]|jgi:drug/metabolite transporter (DMT)-like permease|uniref:EamA family transporter n=1 Tax=Phenylobacterium sp. TaxID=1871053 RepID=UPI002FD9FE7B
MSPKDMLLCAGVALALPLGQVMFKWAAVYHARLEGALVWRLAQNVPLMGAFVWYSLTALLWFYVLTRVPLSQAYPFSILGSALVPVFAAVLFREQLTWPAVFGYALMLSGFLLVMRSQASA